MQVAVITKLHSRTTALIAACAFLLFALLPVIHVATADADHNGEHCPLCQTLQHAGNLLAPDASALSITQFLPVRTIGCPDLSIPVGVPVRAHRTRAPPAA
ncbi:hypothetical protein CO151_00935 [bacterium CG_4_9_14_3_um_filter_65_15]|nr:MAG: hypothetical protein CO151_00935 [bacterium CG_4_9_14_3_um_filter_65_15]